MGTFSQSSANCLSVQVYLDPRIVAGLIRFFVQRGISIRTLSGNARYALETLYTTLSKQSDIEEFTSITDAVDWLEAHGFSVTSKRHAKKLIRATSIEELTKLDIVGDSDTLSAEQLEAEERRLAQEQRQVLERLKDSD